MENHNRHDDNNCTCGHVHDHSDEHFHGDIECHEGHEHDVLFGQTDEIPAIYSDTFELRFGLELSSGYLCNCLTEWIESVKNWAAENKYFIGHIKAFVISDVGSSFWLSTTGQNVMIKTQQEENPELMSRCELNATMIVFGCEAEYLKKTSTFYLGKSFCSVGIGIRDISN